MSDPPESNAWATFLHRIGGLKETPRTGWLDRGIPASEAESVADHTFRTAVLAWMVSAEEPGLDRERVLKLALLHDLAEALTGDIPPDDSLEIQALEESVRRERFNNRQIMSLERKEAKQEAERIALLELLSDLPPQHRAEIDALLTEMQERTTPESRFVKQVDVLETWMQSREYAQRFQDLPVGSFQAEVDEVLSFSSLKEIRDALPAVLAENET